ncbi:MAG: LysM peptidoglycan-binding domain-containing protein [Bacteroidota bacterium]
MRSLPFVLALAVVTVSAHAQQATRVLPLVPYTVQSARTIDVPHGSVAPLTLRGTSQMEEASFVDERPELTAEALQGDVAVYGLDDEPLTQQQVLNRMARLYRYQANIMEAQATGNDEKAIDVFQLAMTELGVLLEQPETPSDTRFRELYRTIVTEYEAFYGVESDTLTFQRGEIFELRAEMFAELNAVDEPLLEDVTFPNIQPMPTEVPLTMNRLVQSSINYLLRRPDRNINPWMRRSETYFPMIEQIFREEEVPDELKYLAMIESGLVPTAKSWARAVGMWQFIAATGGAYGLDVDSWVDERRDPEKATRAAARHLRDLYEQYGNDWHLAIAGYNCSPRCIKRGIRRAKQEKGVESPTFWDIYEYLPRETRNYVPMYIAAALTASNPEAFGLQRPEPGPRYEYDFVPVRGSLTLKQVAEMVNSDVETIQALNPELRRNAIPPTQGVYYLRVPLSTGNQFMAAYQLLPEEQKQLALEHRVRRGDTLGAIARRYGITVSQLRRMNNLRGSTIHPGQQLTVTSARGTGISENDKVEIATLQPQSVQYGPRMIRPLASDIDAALAQSIAPRSSSNVRTASTTTTAASTSSTSAERAANSNTRVTYRVRRGDTLNKIARRYGVSVSDLRNWNSLRSTRINTGQRLSIYAANPPAASSASSTTGSKVTYRVRRGDTLSEIAKRYGVRVSDLRRWNNLSSSRIRSGQRLTIERSGNASSTTPQATTYTVRRGDSLYSIAKNHGTSVSNIKRWNSLSSNRIKPGQKLTVRN